MVCDRCKRTVENILKRSHLNYTDVKLGEVFLATPLTNNERQLLTEKLREEGFELLEDRDSRLVNQIKTEVMRFVRQQEETQDINLSTHLSRYLNKEYSGLSKLFSQVESRTIENYYIEQRIERAKELLVYNELSLSEIADQLAYSSVTHLSSQFKRITGMTPTYFKKLGAGGRKKLDEV